MTTGLVDPWSARLAAGAGGLLAEFNRAGVLLASDVHVAVRLGRLGGEDDEWVALATALAVRGPRFGHVYADLSSVAITASADTEAEAEAGDPPPVEAHGGAPAVEVNAAGGEAAGAVAGLAWPEPVQWLQRLANSPLVSVGEDGPVGRPLRLIGTALYLDRYWCDERMLAADLATRAGAQPPPVDRAVLAGGLQRLFADDTSGEQRWAAAAGLLRRLAVIAGGPGTGKTTTVARLIALLEEQADAAGARPPLIALAAPTGKAAARMQEAVRAEAARLDVSEDIRRRLLGVGASTIHRLLGSRPHNSSRFNHHRHNRLPHDVLVVDETSMVPLALMARLTEAVRPDARLVLAGDPRQLASVEAGAVLGDIVGPAADKMRMRPPARAELGALTGADLPADDLPAGTAIGDGIVLLRANHRFGGALGELAGAIRAGDGDAAVAVLSTGDPALCWVAGDPAGAGPDPPGAVGADPVRDAAVAGAGAVGADPVRDAAVAAGAALFAAAADGDGPGALDALGAFRVLCAHRRGPAGVSSWTQRIESWLEQSVPGFRADAGWYLGRPVMVTANDYCLRLFNGDTGAAVSHPGGGYTVVFNQTGSPVAVSPSRLGDVETVFAMTVHKAQGSEFPQVAVILPPPSSAVLTRELLYTAATRARDRLILSGTEEAVRAAVGRPIARASGLTARLWAAP